MVFISYSWADSDTAHRVADTLISAGVKVWIDYKEIDTQCPLESQILDGIQKSVLLIVISSTNSSKSRWVQFEINKALYLKKIIIALRIL